MPTMIYNPGVQVYVEVTDKKTNRKRILDLSEDLIDGQVTRRVNAPSTFEFHLQNGGRKYDYPEPIFQPNDRIIINMKRIKWMRVLTGYLTQVPVFSVWPGNITLTGHCTLKRLQYWFWDPHLPATYQLVNDAITQGQSLPTPDGGISAVAMAILDQVVGWKKDRVHIAAIPHDWYDFVAPLAEEVEADAEATQAAGQAVLNTVGGNANVGGQSGSGQPSGTQGVVQGTSVLQGVPVPATSGKISDFGGANDGGTNYGNNHMANGIPTVKADPYYCAMRWDYHAAPGGANWYFGNGSSATAKKLIVTCQRTSKTIVVYAADWGPAAWTGRVLDLDPRALEGLGARTDDSVTIQWVQDQNGVNVGPVTGNEAGNTGNNQPVTPNPGPATRADGSPATADALAFLNTALNLVETQQVPYREGGDSPASDPTPNFLDCSSFVMWVLGNTLGTLQPPGTHSPIPRTVATQVPWALANGGTKVSATQGMTIPGAVMVIEGQHTEISLGNSQQTVGAHHTGTFASVIPYPASSWSYAYLMPGITYTDANGKVITGSPGQNVYTNGSAGNQAATNPLLNTTIQTDAIGNDPIDKLFNASTWVALPNDQSGLIYTGSKALMNDEVLFPYLNNLFNAAQRQWSSAPNGDIMAWFPDYFGVWGTAAVMVLEDIELQDFSVAWSDEALVTHEFVTGGMGATGISQSDGTISSIGFDQFQADIATRGIASIDIKTIMGALFKIKPTVEDTAKFRDYIYQRFGARPEAETIPGIYGPKGEFFFALYMFMQRWASQFTCNIPMTFMPELWPGMLVRLPNYAFQAYIQQVQHRFKFGPNGSFMTTATIVAPTVIGNNPMLFGLPSAPQYRPGTVYDKTSEHFSPNGRGRFAI